LNRARTIERQAAVLREGLARLARRDGERGDVQRAIHSIRDQFALAEKLADELGLGDQLDDGL
jgi:hypothetical protein